MRFSGRLVLTLLCALVLAGLVHLATVLAIPRLSERTAFWRLGDQPADGKATLIPTGDERPWPMRPDPAVVLAACRYDLAAGPARIAARTGALFESLSFFSRTGTLFFSVTDRAAVRGALDLVVMTKPQLDAAIAEDDEPSRDVRVLAPQSDGFVIVRVLATSASDREEAQAAARSVSCSADTARG